MVRVTTIHDEHLRFSSTFVGRAGQWSQEREYYLARETGLILNIVLTEFANGNREIARSFFCTLSAAYQQEIPFGLLVAIKDYIRERVIYFEYENDKLSRLSIWKLSPAKELVSLGVPDTIETFSLPEHPFSFYG